MTDWKKRLDDAASGIGRGIRKAADGARKVAGIGVGEIILGGSRRARRGGLYRGTIELRLSEPVDESTLELTLYGKKTRLVVERLRQGAASRETITVFKRVTEVSPHGTHDSGSFDFEIEVPRDTGGPEIDGWLGDAVRAVQALKSLTESEIRWSLEARLKIPWRRDVTKTVDLSIEDGLGGAPPPRAKKTGVRAAPIPVGQWRASLDSALEQLVDGGARVIRADIRGPVDFAEVAPVVAIHPDLDPRVLTFYGLGDGVDVEIERGGETRRLVIPRFAELFEPGAAAPFRLARSEDIHRERDPILVAALDAAGSDRTWWVVRDRVPRLLGWEEMLGAALEHLLKSRA